MPSEVKPNPDAVLCCAECGSIGRLNPRGIGIDWSERTMFMEVAYTSIMKHVVAYVHCDRCQIADETPEVIRILNRIPEC
jgi:hypothetical protein